MTMPPTAPSGGTRGSEASSSFTTGSRREAAAAGFQISLAAHQENGFAGRIETRFPDATGSRHRP